MIKFEDACKQVGYDRTAEWPKPIFKYFAYKSGKAHEFETMKEALAFSKNVEKAMANQDEIDVFRNRQREGEHTAVDLWMKELRDDYPELTDKQFGIIYDKAYEDGYSVEYDEDDHSAGYDEVGLHFQDLYYFCMKFVKAGE